MDRFDMHLKKEEYDKLKGMNHAQICEELKENILNPAIVWGYGFYGCGEPFEKDGEYFINITTGSTCD